MFWIQPNGVSLGNKLRESFGQIENFSLNMFCSWPHDLGLLKLGFWVHFDTPRSMAKSTTCSMHSSSLHAKQPGLMWTAVALHVAAPSGQLRHCCQLVLFSTVTPARGRVRQAVSIAFMAASWPGPARFTNVKPGLQVLQPTPSSVTRPPKTGSQSILSR